MVIIRYDSCLYYKDNGCPLYGVPVSVLCVLCFGGVCLLAFFSLVLFDEVYAGGADYQHDSCQHKHIDFRRQSSLGSKQGKDGAAQSSCYNLRDTDSTVEKSQISTMCPPLSALVRMVNGSASMAAHAQPISKKEMKSI